MARVFVRGHYLFRNENRFPRGKHRGKLSATKVLRRCNREPTRSFLPIRVFVVSGLVILWKLISVGSSTMLLVISNITFVVIFMLRTNSYKCKAIAFKVLFVFNLQSSRISKNQCLFWLILSLKWTQTSSLSRVKLVRKLKQRENCSVLNNI